MARRWRAGFLAERFWDRERLAPLEENFWVNFFRGAQLKAGPPEPVRAPAAPLAPGRLAH